MRCARCGFANPEGTKFCGECGSPLTNRCPSCGGENPPLFKFCGQCGTTLTGRQKAKGKRQKTKEQASSDSRRETLDPRLSSAERRQLTVMFCDLVGSTALSEQLDPEELREVVQRYQETCTDIIQRHEGHIAQHLGDGLLVYFGYPNAHENDAQRAVRTGLGIIEALHHLNTRLSYPLQVRIGIHTGLVVVGEIGSSERRELLPLGDTPSLSARRQALASPHAVVISATTSRLVQWLFEWRELGPQTVKGLSTPLAVYQVIKESTVHSRFEVAVRTGLTPLVGREQEVSLLL